MTAVAIRRKSDRKFLIGGNSLIPIWSDKPRFMKSEAKAHIVVRVDLGHDLAEYEFIKKQEFESEQ